MKHFRIKTRIFRRAALSLLTLVMTFTAQTAWADDKYGWYDGAMTIGGATTDVTAWSSDGSNPTDLGIVDNMTITNIALSVWSDANDRVGANMFFRIWDGGSSQVGADQDLWLGVATRIEGKAHDFAISWTGTLDLAAAVSLTLIPGKTYYIDMYAKTYGTSGDEWYSANNANFHAKLIYAPSGNCGTTDHESEVTWSLNSGGVLTISGSGAMANYSSLSAIPWSSYISDITSVVIGEGVTTIGKGAFFRCNNLASVSIPASVTSIGIEAFAESGSSTGMAVAIATGSALETISNNAFLSSNLVSITLPYGLTTIGINAFNGCGKLATVSIPASVTSIGGDAFGHCSSLTTVIIPASVTSIGDLSFYKCYNLASVSIPASVTSIGESAFTECGKSTTALTVTFVTGSTLTTIGESAFEGANLTSITIPANVTTIGNKAFTGCVNLASVSIPRQRDDHRLLCL